MKELVLGIGGNLENRLENLEKTRDLIEKRLGRIIKISSLYESEPWGFESGNWFLNQVVIADCAFDPLNILEIIHKIESDLGRVKTGVYADRQADVDIIFFGEMIFENSLLQIPHPHIHKRNFVLQALNEIIPEFIHPVIGKSCGELLVECRDTAVCRMYQTLLP